MRGVEDPKERSAMSGASIEYVGSGCPIQESFTE